MVSLYDGDESVVVEAVQRDERARLEDLDGLPELIREWETGSARPGPAAQKGNRDATPSS